MKLLVSKLKPNPFRRIDAYPIDRVKVDSLKASIEETTFWDNLLARPAGKGYEIAYGHHRLVALQEAGIKEVDIPVRDIDDGTMIRIMANENRDSYKANRAVTIETVRVARDWLRDQMDKGWEFAHKSMSELFKDAHAFNIAKAQGIGQGTIKKFLGRDWKDWEIQEALSQMEETDTFDPKALEEFDHLAVASEAKSAMQKYKVPKERQKAIAKTLVKKGVSKANIKSEVAQIAHAEGYSREKKDLTIKVPPMLDKVVTEITKDIGSLNPRISKIRGYTSHIQKQHVKISLKANAKILHSYLGEILQELQEKEE